MEKEENTKKDGLPTWLILVVIGVLGVAVLVVAGQKGTCEEKLASVNNGIAGERQKVAMCEADLQNKNLEMQVMDERVELVFINPRIGCEDLCPVMEPLVEEMAEKNSMYYRKVLYPMNMSTPGVFVLTKGTMSQLWPINSQESLLFVMCDKLGFDMPECPAPDMGAPAVPETPVNNTAPVITNITTNGTVVG